jgi:hypothetical protein
MNLLPQSLFERFMSLPMAQELVTSWKLANRAERKRCVESLVDLAVRRNKIALPLLEAREAARRDVTKAERELEKKRDALRQRELELAQATLSLDGEQSRHERFLRDRADYAITDFLRRVENQIDIVDLMPPTWELAPRDPLNHPLKESRIVRDISPVRDSLVALRAARDAARELHLHDPDTIEAELARLEEELPPLARLVPSHTGGMQ